MTDELRKEVVRERRTEAEVRKLDASDIVSWIHRLEDDSEELQSELDRLRQQLAERWTASDTDYDRSIHHNPDAAAWADLFMQTFPNCGADRDIMLGWFANAIMSMYDAKVAPIKHERDRIADDYERAMHRVGQLESQLSERGEPVAWTYEYLGDTAMRAGTRVARTVEELDGDIDMYPLTWRRCEPLFPHRSPGGAGDVVRKYYELLYAVASVFPGETRHETALRYILRAEEGCNSEDAAIDAAQQEGSNGD